MFKCPKRISGHQETWQFSPNHQQTHQMLRKTYGKTGLQPASILELQQSFNYATRVVNLPWEQEVEGSLRKRLLLLL